MINCHTHIFNEDHVPEHFISPILIGLSNLLENGKVTAALEAACIAVGKEGWAEQVARKHQFITVGREKKPEWRMLQDLLIPAYPADTKFIVLSMDMEYMQGGASQRSYLQQLEDLTLLKRTPNYGPLIYPFVAADPRRPGLLELVRSKIEEDHFYGIKIYPPLGYFPFDERLFPVFEYAQEHEIPVMSHCSRGGIFYHGFVQKRHPRTGVKIPGQSNNRRTEGFTDPSNYQYVLERFPNLKICLAHWGGQAEWKKLSDRLAEPPPIEMPPTWPEVINDLLRNSAYPHVYTDISFTLYDTVTCLPLLNSWLGINAIKNNVLFGSDYYMELQNKSEPDFLSGVRNGISAADLELISDTNAKNYLRSRVHRDV